MSVDSSGRTPGGGLPRALPLQCSGCATDTSLAIKSIETLYPASDTEVEVAYTCTACGHFYAHRADVAQVALILNRAGRPPGMLIFGGHYIHCGQPMRKTGSELRRLPMPASADQDSVDALDVYLSTRVLRCCCGFQMELPE